jgi:hypothetical protein
MTEECDERDFPARLAFYVERSGYHVAQVARLSGIPRTTLAGWLNGETHKPRVWQDVAQVARALRLERGEADELLYLACHPNISRLRRQARTKRERALLSFWPPMGGQEGEQPGEAARSNGAHEPTSHLSN